MTLFDLDAPRTQRTCCPTCGTEHTDGAFDARACSVCTARATDSRGRLLRFEPIGSGDAFEARFRLPTDTERAETAVAADVTAFRTCFIDNQPFHVERDGAAIYLLPLAHTLAGGRR